MPSVGPMELLMIATVALIVFGPDKLPRIARQAGRYAAELRRMATEVRDEFESSVSFDEDEDEDEDEASDEIVVPEEGAPSAEAPDGDEDEPAKDKPADPDDTEH